jgi:hypothetical protein
MSQSRDYLGSMSLFSHLLSAGQWGTPKVWYGERDTSLL